MLSFQLGLHDAEFAGGGGEGMFLDGKSSS
jgi:hypothetical protein